MKKLYRFIPALSFAIVPCTDNCTFGDLNQLVINIFKYLMDLSVPLAILALIYAGFLFVTSGGSPQRIEEGKEAIKAAVIGLVIVFGAWFIYKAIYDALTGKSIFSLIPVAYAIAPPPGVPTDLITLITNITGGVLEIAGGVIVIMIMYGAFLILTSANNPKRYDAGKQTIIYSLIGLVIILFSSWLVHTIANLGI